MEESQAKYIEYLTSIGMHQGFSSFLKSLKKPTLLAISAKLGGPNKGTRTELIEWIGMHCLMYWVNKP